MDNSNVIDPFVDPTETVRLPLRVGEHWVEVRRRLSYAQEQQLRGAGIGRLTEGGKEKSAGIGLEIERFEIEKRFTWIVGWSFQRAGKAVAVSRDAIRALKPVRVEAIDAVLDPHVQAIEDEKKAFRPTTSDDDE